MSNNYFNMEAIKRAAKKGTLILATGAVLCTLTGCEEREVSTNARVQYDLIDTQDQNLVTSGIQQVLDVPGESFKLVVGYRCLLGENEKWTITSDKQMFMDISTSGLDANTRVYIDNVHTDTTIKSYYPSVDGITQDSMDDRVHNSLMKGFPISDVNHYSSVNCIEGQNQTFMQGSFYGFNGYQSGTIEEKRYIESDYLSAGVTGNKIDSVIDLIIDKPDGTTTCVSVPSTIGVSVWPYVEKVDDTGRSTFRFYYYDERHGRIEYKDYTEEEYNHLINPGRQYTK